MNDEAKFDAYAGGYQRLVADSVSASGESPEYFQLYKIQCLERRGLLSAGPILDFGCGVGGLTQHLGAAHREVHGYDPSAESLEQAKKSVPGAKLHGAVSDIPDAHFGLAVLSGVLHHVPVVERLELARNVRKKLRPGGTVAVFEHNPFNPLTQRTVRMCPFDDDAVLLWPWQARSLLSRAGFGHVALDFIVFFPRPLAGLRRFEPRLRWLPAGAQYLVTAR